MVEAIEPQEHELCAGVDTIESAAGIHHLIVIKVQLPKARPFEFTQGPNVINC